MASVRRKFPPFSLLPACGNRVNPDKLCFKCGPKIPQTSHERRDEAGEKASPTMPLLQYTASKSEERRGFGKPHNGLKRKGSNTLSELKKYCRQ